MNLADITPLILTYNEAPNLRRTLSSLPWASRIVIVDSGSTDDTLAIAREFSQVTIVNRPFDTHTNQWNYGLRLVETQWVLSLDADYQCPDELRTELAKLDSTCDIYYAAFTYCIFGRALRSSLYPPRAVLFQPNRSGYIDDGHTQLLDSTNMVAGYLSTPIRHDDHKPIDVWFRSQLKYAQLEATKILATPVAQMDWKDRLRSLVVVAPCLTLVYCLVVKRLILDGWPGVFYSLQRVLAELLLSLTLVDRRLRTRNAQGLEATP